jgi:hypothetical protein
MFIGTKQEKRLSNNNILYVIRNCSSEGGAYEGRGSPRQSSVPGWVLNRHGLQEQKVLQGSENSGPGIRINFNAGAVTTSHKGTYRRLQVWYLPKGIANIISMHELEKTYCITYDRWDRYCAVHTPRGEVLFYKDKQGLLYIDLEGSDQDVAMMLVQEHIGMSKFDEAKGMSLIQTVRGNHKGYTKKEVLQAQEACRAQAMLGNPNEKDFKGMVSTNISLTALSRVAM